MSKGPWEERVGSLLKGPGFAWAYKPVDSPLHGGAVRIDWLACDRLGMFWMVEVKSVPLSARSFNLENPKFISALQIEALDAVGQASASEVHLAVGQGQRLYIFDWRRLRWLHKQQSGRSKGLIPLLNADATLEYTTRKAWKEIPLGQVVQSFLRTTPDTPTGSTPATETKPSGS